MDFCWWQNECFYFFELNFGKVEGIEIKKVQMGWGFIYVMYDDWMYDGLCVVGINVDVVLQEIVVVDLIKEDVMKKFFVFSVL